MKVLRRAGIVLCILILLAGCSSDKASPQPVADRTVEKSLKAPLTDDGQEGRSSFPSPETALKKDEPPQAAATEGVPPEQKVMYQANVTMRVSRFEHARKQMEKESLKLGGYLVNGSESRSDQTLRGTFVFRIPQDRFQDFLSVLEKLALEIPSKQINGTDITEEYVDLKSRLRAKQAVEKRLLELMKQADKPEDLLNITKHLSQVQEEIETIKGRIRYLDNRTAYATVTVHLEQPVVLENPDGELWQQITQSFLDSIAWLLNAFRKSLVLLAAALPPLLILAVIGIPLWQWYRRRKSSKAKSSDEQ